MSRWMFFILAIALGVGLGLLYGWVISPVQYVDTSPETLRVDYQTDYVLMVAEAYFGENNLALAIQRLSLLGTEPPDGMVREAIVFAEELRYQQGAQNSYTDADLSLMRTLATDLETYLTSLATTTP